MDLVEAEVAAEEGEGLCALLEEAGEGVVLDLVGGAARVDAPVGGVVVAPLAADGDLVGGDGAGGEPGGEELLRAAVGAGGVEVADAAGPGGVEDVEAALPHGVDGALVLGADFCAPPAKNWGGSAGGNGCCENVCGVLFCGLPHGDVSWSTEGC